MRSVPVAILLSTAFLLAGCSGGGDGDDDLHYVCADGTEVHSEDHPEVNATKAEDLAKFCVKSTTTGSRTNTTSQAPNVPPILVLNITDPGGNVTPVTMLDGNLTFDATGSRDPDGTIAGIAVTVTDSNTTRTATLYDAVTKTFKTATFTFDRPGPVNVTVAMVDDRAGFTVNQTHVYVNHLQHQDGGNIALPMGHELPGQNDPCTGGNDLTDAQYFKSPSFVVVAGATRIDVVAESSSAVMTICDPTGTPVSEEYATGGEVTTLPDAVLVTPSGTDSYKVGIYSSSGQMTSAVDILVHYEPQGAAEPAEDA